MRFVVRSACALAAGAALAASALAGSAETKVPGVGGASVRWGDLRYRKQLVDQLQPGLTWRLGSGAATRLETTGMVLACDGGLLPPGAATLNLRFTSMTDWALVAFEEDDWRWSEDKRHFAVVPCRVWRETDAKRQAPKLSIVLRAVPGRSRTEPPAGPAVTGGAPAPGERPKPQMESPVTYSKEAQAELDKAPWLEVEMRFGDLTGLVAFEAAEAGELKTRRTDAAKTPIAVTWPRFTAVRAKTELVETGTEVTFGVLREGDAASGERLLVVSGGAEPELELRRIGRSDPPTTKTGRRVETKGEPKTVTWEATPDGLVLHLFHVDYVFPY